MFKCEPTDHFHTDCIPCFSCHLIGVEGFTFPSDSRSSADLCAPSKVAQGQQMPAEKTAMISEINGSKFLFSCQVTRAELEIEGELQGFQTDIVRLDLMQSRSNS